MLANLKTPGVYVQEISVLPPAVAAVPTATPAFIGYTEVDAGDEPIKIASQLDFEALFGRGPRPAVGAVSVDADGGFVSGTATSEYYLYDAIRLFYANGGGECYVVSVGTYGDPVTRDDFNGAGEALARIALLDEPTLLLFPDAATLPATDLGAIQVSALDQCAALQDRFTICDCRADDPLGTAFRANVGMSNIKYGAAYTPWLRSRMDRGIAYAQLRNVTVTLADGSSQTGFSAPGNAELSGLLERYELVADVEDAYPDFVSSSDPTDLTAALDALHGATDADPGGTPAPVAAARAALDTGVTDYAAIPAGDEARRASALVVRERYTTYRTALETAYRLEDNLRTLLPLYRNIATGLNDLPREVPPSGAVAGIYARTDAQRGVWKAPANESLKRVLEPARRFTRSELEGLNVDTTAGKSINAIRAFTGKGTLVFGARTLAGNDNENRYVNVRRLLIFLEESIRKACEDFVFEPNDANTWLRVRGMIENFLNLQWRAGALQGAKAEEAFRVAIGLGRTMTPDDVYNGRLIVEISLAPVRPAEFIVLRFAQLQVQA